MINEINHQTFHKAFKKFEKFELIKNRSKNQKINFKKEFIFKLIEKIFWKSENQFFKNLLSDVVTRSTLWTVPTERRSTDVIFVWHWPNTIGRLMIVPEADAEEVADAEGERRKHSSFRKQKTFQIIMKSAFINLIIKKPEFYF